MLFVIGMKLDFLFLDEGWGYFFDILSDYSELFYIIIPKSSESIVFEVFWLETKYNIETKIEWRNIFFNLFIRCTCSEA